MKNDKVMQEPSTELDTLHNILDELYAVAKTREHLYYFKSLFDFVDVTFNSFMRLYEKLKYEDERLQHKLEKINDLLESRMVEAALAGKINSSLAQFILANKFDFNQDKQQDYNITIVYDKVSKEDVDE